MWHWWHVERAHHVWHVFIFHAWNSCTCETCEFFPRWVVHVWNVLCELHVFEPHAKLLSHVRHVKQCIANLLFEIIQAITRGGWSVRTENWYTAYVTFASHMKFMSHVTWCGLLRRVTHVPNLYVKRIVRKCVVGPNEGSLNRPIGAVQLLRNALGGGGGHGVTHCDRGRGVGRALRNA